MALSPPYNQKSAEEQDAVIYARYSSHAQRDVSIEQQVKACRQFAERQGLRIVEVYEDHALTGTSDRRPGFQKMIRDAERGTWPYVIVYTLDRFARDRYDSAVYKRQLKNCGVKVLSAMENISDDPTGILLESMLEGLAEYYSKELARKTRRGMEDNASKCLVNGPLPLGYVRGEDGRYALDEAEAAIVLEVFQRVANGERLSVLITDFNDRGILTKSGCKWNRSSFNRLLSNERYTGVYIYGDVRIPGGVPQIVPQELFDSVQHLLSIKSNPRSSAIPQRRRRERGLYLLTGKLYCGLCKSPMTGISGNNKNGAPYFYYVCRAKHKDHTCKKRNVPREKIEQRIATALKDTMLTDKAIYALSAAAVEYQKACFSNSEAEALRTRLAEITQSIKNLVAAVEAGIFSAATQNRLIELEKEQKTVSGQLAIALEDIDEQLTLEDMVTALKIFQGGDVSDKRYQEALIDTFLVAAYVYDDKIKIVFNLGGKKKEDFIPFDIDDVDLTGTCTSSLVGHQTILYEHFGTTVVMIGDLFVFSCPM